jgi:microcystin-dependent protein
MPFVIPNAIDTTGSNRYNSLDQAEPDSLDFQLLGNRSTGVLSGGEVTAQSVANYTVAVASGHVVLDGTVYSIPSNPALILPSVPSNTRFDLVVARLVNGSMALTVLSGPNSASNPSFPPTPSQLTTVVGVPLTNYVNPNTDVVLAAVLRSGAANVTKAHIVDKRVTVASTSLRGDAVPSNTFGNNGDLYYKSSLSGDAGLYVKLNGTWEQVGTGGPSVGAGTPVGAVITWVSGTASPDPLAWLECNGQSISRTTYAGLFSVLGTAYGSNDSLTFKVPDFRGHFLMGLSGSRTLATAYGNAGNSINLTINQMPEHSHEMDSGVIQTNGDHSHTAGNGVGILIANSSSSTSTGSLNFWAYPWYFTTTVGVGSTNTAGAHSHAISGRTRNTGYTEAINIEPRNYGVRYFIKYA